MKRIPFLLLSLVASVSLTHAATSIRVASYNIMFLDTDFTGEGDRLTKLREVLTLLDADVIGLQEIKDRESLKQLFPPADWSIVIDEDSGDNQDVAAVVRKPLEVVNLPADLDADDEHFLFEGPSNNSNFPNRRDLLAVQVRIPSENQTFWLFVHHAKARVGGRATTDHRREGAARQIVTVLEHDFDDQNFVLVGDFNDNPDDRSLNILETGNPNAPGGPEEIDGPFLINLVEPLLAAGHVSHGREALDIIGNAVNTIDPQSRQRNNDARATNKNTGDILFDQLLIPMRMQPLFIQGSAAVFNNSIAVQGTAKTRASDHLPVFADFQFGVEPATEGTIQIAALFPNPAGIDAGKERVTLHNPTSASFDMTDCFLWDRSNNKFALSGSIAAGQSVVITMTPPSMPLNNDGDRVTLVNRDGVTLDEVTYTAAQVVSGQEIVFGNQ